jgi:Tol biopolymer transport system component
MTLKATFVSLLCLAALSACVQRGSDSLAEEREENQKPQADFRGRIVFHSNMDGDNEIYLLAEGRLERLTDNDWQDEYPVWSPDGSRIAYTANPEGRYNIHVMGADGRNTRAVTSSDLDEKEPAWFSDGLRIAFSREKKGIIQKGVSLFAVNIQTGAEERCLPRYNKTHAIPHVSPLGNLITFTGKRSMGWDVAVYDPETRSLDFLDEGGKSCRARFSPDGRRLAYVSSKADGKGDIWLMKPDGTGKKRLTERDETYDYFPSWSPDGRQIVFNSSSQHNHNGDWALYIVDVETGRATLLFDSPGNDVFPDWH